MSPDGHRLDIEGLRAVAVLLVVGFHAGVGLVPGGFVGVDVFYVISGFLITGLLADEALRTGRISLARFYARRARRLLPLSALVLAVTAVASFTILPPLDHGTAAADLRSAALWFANWHFAEASTQYMAATGQSPVLHYWSLSVEEQFYVLWPLILLLVLGRTGLALRSPRVATRRLVAALACIGVVSLVLSILLTSSTGSWAYFGLHTRAWELAAGGGLALARPLIPRLPRAVAALGGWCGLALVVWAAVSFGTATAFPGSAAIVPVAGTVLLLLAGMIRHPGGVSALLARPVPAYIGRISYGWYLWHWPCLLFARQLASGGAVGDPEQAEAPSTSPVWLVSAVLLSFLLAAVSAVLLEQPVRRGRWLSALPRRSLAMAAALTIVSVFSATALASTTPGIDRSSHVTASSADAPKPLAPTPSAVPTTAGTSTIAPPARTIGRGWTLAKALTVSPATARADHYIAPGCYVFYPELAPRKGCQFGDPNGKFVVVVLGDSHAAQWMPALQTLAQQRRWQLWFWAKSLCPMQKERIWISTLRRSYRECDSWRAGIEARLTSLPRLDLVVLARTSTYLHLLVDERGRSLGRGPGMASWERASARLFARLHEVGAKRVLQLQDTPRAAQDVPACLSENRTRIQRCDFPRARGVTPDVRLLAAERRAAADHPDVAFVSMTDYLCPGDPCPATTPKGAIVYRDNNHMTASFSRSLWEGLGQRFDEALAAAP